MARQIEVEGPIGSELSSPYGTARTEGSQQSGLLRKFEHVEVQPRWLLATDAVLMMPYALKRLSRFVVRTRHQAPEPFSISRRVRDGAEER